MSSWDFPLKSISFIHSTCHQWLHNAHCILTFAFVSHWHLGQLIYIFNKLSGSLSRTGSFPLSEESVSLPFCFPELLFFPFSLYFFLSLHFPFPFSFPPIAFSLLQLPVPLPISFLLLFFSLFFLFPPVFSFSVSHQYSTPLIQHGNATVFFSMPFPLEWGPERGNPQYCV